MHYTIWLTRECNLKCKYCYETINKQHGQMTFEMADTVLSYIKKDLLLKSYDKEHMITFHGGEPLINYKVMKYMLKKINKWNMRGDLYLNVTTNGTLLDYNEYQFLIENLNEISFSIDGIKVSHDLNRRDRFDQGTYLSVVDRIKYLLTECNYSDRLNARMTITPNNYIYLYDSLVYLYELGLKSITPVIDKTVKWDKKAFESIYNDYIRFYNDVYRYSELNMGIYEILDYRGNICGGGTESFHFDCNGDFYPCAYVVGNPNICIGNVLDGIYEEKVEEIVRINRDNICKPCSWNDMCLGNRCKLINYALTDNFYTPTEATCLTEHLLLRIHKYIRLNSNIDDKASLLS